MTLHITNGDSAASGIRSSGAGGRVLSWNDVLHDGPVPGVSLAELRPIRARFIADSGWRTYDDALHEFAERDAVLESAADEDEVVLWFEHDLYDQLQLLQLLDWFAEHPPRTLSLICDAEYLGLTGPQRLAERFPSRKAVRAEQLQLAARAWAAFRSDDPTAIEAIIDGDHAALPFLGAALRRHLEQFPSTKNGLSRSEAQMLDALARGPSAPRAVYYHSHHQREDAVFLGDSSFAQYLSALSRCREPLVLTVDGRPLGRETDAGFWNTAVTLTSFGQAVAAGDADHVRTNGVDRWLGGVHLHGTDAQWRWDGERSTLVRTPG